MIRVYTVCYSIFHKNPKNLDTRKICCNHPKILTRWLYCKAMHPNDADGIANSVDPPNQTAPLGAGSSLIWVSIVCPDLSFQKLRMNMVYVLDALLYG